MKCNPELPLKAKTLGELTQTVNEVSEEQANQKLVDNQLSEEVDGVNAVLRIPVLKTSAFNHTTYYNPKTKIFGDVSLKKGVEYNFLCVFDSVPDEGCFFQIYDGNNTQLIAANAAGLDRVEIVHTFDKDIEGLYITIGGANVSGIAKIIVVGQQNVIEELTQTVNEVSAEMDGVNAVLRIPVLKTTAFNHTTDYNPKTKIFGDVSLKKGVEYNFLCVFDSVPDEGCFFQIYDGNNTQLIAANAAGLDRVDIVHTFDKDIEGLYITIGGANVSGIAKIIVVGQQNVIEELSAKSTNTLYRKKWVACGDSFTAGDFTGIGTNAETYDYDMQLYKTYPWYIAKRNGMNLVNEAVCASTIALHKDHLDDPTFGNPFSHERYTAVPDDADYITLSFGINDCWNCNLGEITDTTNSTFYGAWNVVMKYLIEHHPTAKIGIIDFGSNMQQGLNFRSAVREIAKKWGVPIMDFMGDGQIPPMLYGREASFGLEDSALNARRSVFVVSASNGHPNVKAHEYQSTFIEHWLRSL